MSARAKDDDGVHRLVDIVVEEVSLVDRAANKHRFLIVKRSNDMDETTTAAEQTGADDTEQVEDLAATADHDEGADASEDAASDTATETPLAVALAALEGLTEAVEVLGAAGGDEARTRLAGLAGEIRAVADRMTTLAGGTDAAAADAAQSAATTGSGAASAGDALATAIASVRSTLEQIRTAVSAPPPAAAAALPGADAATAPTSGTDVAAQLAALTEQVRGLAGSFKEHQQRLARLEKRFGLPNSAPSGERPRRPEDEADVSWPLDLNRGLDRESVDKAVSFHDV